MNILNIEHISKVYGEKVIFDDVSFGIHEGDKIGIIGINGTGKTTLLKMIAGLEEGDSGQVIRQNGLRVTYLPQHPEFPKGATVLSHVVDGKIGQDWSTESEAKTILYELGISQFDEEIAHLSGGQKKRVALARTLVNPADVLILDEPTNHLDNEMASWLETFLNQFKGVVIMVTHDRYFLDRVTNKILEISHGKLYSYTANYSEFLELKVQREEMELASERKRQSILRMEIEWAKRGCRARTTKQKARLDRLEALKNGTAPKKDVTAQIDSVETRMGKKTVELHHISKGYGEKKLIDDFDYIVLKNQRIGIIGPNGCGKSTLLKIIAGQIPPDAGEREIGETVKIGYFAQEVPDMDTNQRVIDYVRDIADYVPTREGRISASQMLERFLFTPDMQYSPIGKLSGGEKKRLYLLSILISAPNCLILDEITNDIDIPTLTILEDYLDSFLGIIILVSHDRYFLDNVVDRIFAFEGNGQIRQYEGGYTDYLETRRRMGFSDDGENSSFSGKGKKSTEKSSDKKEKASAKEWKKNSPTKLKFSFKEQKEYETIDEDIAALEEKIEQLDQEMAAYASQYTKLSELTKEKEEAEQALEEKMDRWVYLNDLAERIEAQK
jgi:ATP-binding cassette subfamily F protein uup